MWTATRDTVTILDERTIVREFAARVLYARHHRGLSTATVATRTTKLTAGGLWSIEAGKRANVLLPTLVRIGRGVDVSLEWLLGLDAPEPPFYPTRAGAVTPETVGEVFGARVLAARLRCGLTRTRLAQWSACESTQIAAFERKPDRSCHLTTLHRLAEALNVSPWWLLGEEDGAS